ncbi:hypothetical protein ABKN59_009950 [Abortiporus biennis]
MALITRAKSKALQNAQNENYVPPTPNVDLPPTTVKKLPVRRRSSRNIRALQTITNSNTNSNTETISLHDTDAEIEAPAGILLRGKSPESKFRNLFPEDFKPDPTPFPSESNTSGMVLRGRRRIRFSEVPPPSISHVTRRRRTTMKDFTTTGLDSPVPATTSVAPSNFTTPHTTGLNERNNSNPAVPNLDQTPLSVMSTALNCGTPLTVDSTPKMSISDLMNIFKSNREYPVVHIAVALPEDYYSPYSVYYATPSGIPRQLSCLF